MKLFCNEENKKINYVCKSCGRVDWFWKDLSPMTVCHDCSQKKADEEFHRERKKIDAKQKHCQHVWYILNDGEIDVLLCPKCDKRKYA